MSKVRIKEIPGVDSNTIKPPECAAWEYWPDTLKPTGTENTYGDLLYTVLAIHSGIDRSQPVTFYVKSS